MNIQISRLGLALPEGVQTAAELAPLLGRSEDWILSRTGVASRRIAEGPVQALAAAAVRQVVGDGPRPDLLINASLTPVQLIPDSSVFIQQALGWSDPGVPSFSLHATCMSFVVALHTAASLIASGAYRRIVVVSAEQGSRSRDFDHPESAALIGDGAAAALVEASQGGSALLAFRQQTWPVGAELAQLRGCGVRHHPNDPTTRPEHNLFQMRGPRIYKLAVDKVQVLAHELLDEAGLDWADIDLCVPHQASGPGVAAHSRFLPLPPERVVDVVGVYGNCIAASIPMALAHAEAAGRLARGHRVLVLGTGAGLHVAGLILRW